MGEEFRKGYENPYAAETQAERLGAWQRRQDDERAARRATPQPRVDIEQPPTNFSAHSPASGDEYHSSTSPPSTLAATAKAGATLGTLGALLYLYVSNRWSIPLAVVAAMFGAIGGYIAGAILHLAFIVLRVIVTIGFWIVCAYFALRLLGVVH